MAESQSFLRGATVNSTLDITLITSSFSRSATWFVDLGMHGSDYLPTYITIGGFTRSKTSSRIHPSNWDLFKETLELSCHSGHSYEYFEQLITSTMTEATRSFSVSNESTHVNAVYEHLRAIRRRAERRAGKTGHHEDSKSAHRARKYIKRNLGKLSRKCSETSVRNSTHASHCPTYGE